jgi:5-methylcytosine-specific restriction endonuclease McrA
VPPHSWNYRGLSQEGALTIEKYKACYTCKQKMSAANFNKRSNRKDGLDGSCRACVNSRKRAWNKANPQKVSEMNRKSYLKNPDTFKSAAKLWKQNNPEKAYASSRSYLNSKPGLANSYASARRSKIASGGSFTIRKKFLQKLYSSPCVYCNSFNFIEADHVLPISLGGRHSEGNLVPACRSCNRSKHNDLLIMWKRKRGASYQPTSN